ncbi:MAG: diacylglycerol kinase, partial [Alphaproteobacteria bacterium]|nr:diacylglycerol kinase [Alphaproteobacteria bacterium]
MKRHKNISFLHATKNALYGLSVLYKENAAKREVLLILFSLGLFYQSPTLYPFALLLLSLFILAVEAVNTSIEILCDHVTPDYHPNIRKVKDLGATAILILGVLYASVLCLFIGSNIPPLAELKEMGHHALDVLIDEAPISTFLTGCVFLIGYSIKRKKNWRAMAIAFISLLWAFYFKAVFSWLSVLGIDSLAETQNFDTNEAWFYASTLKSYLKPLTAKSHIIIYTAGAGFL